MTKKQKNKTKKNEERTSKSQSKNRLKQSHPHVIDAIRQVRSEVRGVLRHPMYRVMKLITDGKTDVKTSRITDEKGDDATIALLQKTLENARGVVRSMKLHGFTAWLTVAASMVGSTATAYTTVIPVQPDTTGEFSTFASLFDECKCEEVKLQYSIMRSAGGTVDTLMSLGGLAYDPVDSGAYGALSTLAEADQHQIFVLSQCPIAAVFPNPFPISKHGMSTFEAIMPKSPQVASPTGDLVTGMWSSTAQAAAKWGYIKPYLEAGTTGVSWTIRYVLYYRMAFRSRT